MGDYKKLYNDVCHNLYYSQNIIRVKDIRNKRNKRNAYQVLA
jgi:hypothetical protein